MTFIQFEFVVFFLIVLVSYWSLPRRGQNLLLAGGSAIFYGWVHPWFLILLYSSAVLDFSMGHAMHRHPERKGRFLVISMAGNLGMLGYFKYCDFFIENVISVLGTFGLDGNLHTLGVFLPVGISFYTFQTMSYTIDIYRGELEPRSSFLDYVVFVSFFPQLVAGPVERAKNLLPQMEKVRVFCWQRFESGLLLSIWGVFKKVCVADVISPYVDRVFVLNEPSGPLIWAATLGFCIQILADFSGYTDIARGISRMLGFELMKNFDHPYVSRTPSDFWRRWHISFSTWIRDYIYIAAGGSRGGFAFITRNTFIAMGLSGLWHGAAWNFVIWGLFHAALLTGYRIVLRSLPASLKGKRWGAYVSIPIMFVFTNIGWLIFRQTNFSALVGYFSTNPFSASHAEWAATISLLSICALVSSPMLIAMFAERHIVPIMRLGQWHGLVPRTSLYTLMLLVVMTFGRDTINDFIYFQF